MSAWFFVGVDVGTGSARAGVFDVTGQLLGAAKRDISLHLAGDIAEQSGDDIWDAVAASVRAAVAGSGVAPDDIAGIGFDATCSMVVVGEGGTPLPVGDSTDRNIIVWMDHRATRQARRIDAIGHPVLDYVGGSISPEMQTPKLLWLKENQPDTYARAWQFFDLVDFLTWRATGVLTRSLCSLTCKWTYLGHEQRWAPDYFRAVGLGELADENFRRIGTDALPGGAALGQGLSRGAAEELGLRPAIAVGAGLIDAHAGGLGTVGARGLPGTITSRMAYVFGTSACTMTTTLQPTFVHGVWGPYHSVMLPDLWLNEGGQSAAGAAIEQLVLHHPAATECLALAAAQQMSLVAWLGQQADRAGGARESPRLIGDWHVVPEFLGNRSPLADPNTRAMIAGAGMDRSIPSLVGLYLAGIVSLGYGVRQIVGAQADAGIEVDTMVVSGGAAASSLTRQLLADATGLAVAATNSPEPVLTGAAILGAIASGYFASATEAMQAMTCAGEEYRPNAELRDWHERRYASFLRMQEVTRALRPS